MKKKKKILFDRLEVFNVSASSLFLICRRFHTEFKKSSSRKASSVFIEKKNKQNAIHFPLYCQKLRDNNRKHLQKIENNLKNRQELRTF